MAKRLLTCDCMGTQTLDTTAIAQATGLEVVAPCSALCGANLQNALTALQAGDVAIACQQEALTFEALAEEAGVPPAPLLDLRDRAGWTDDTRDTGPKMAALAAEAMVPVRSDKTIDVESSGACVILGPAEAALGAAEALQDHLSVTVLLAEDPGLPLPPAFDVILGRLRSAQGSLGQFNLKIDALRQAQAPGRGQVTFGPARDGAATACDIVLDLTGGTPLFPAPEKRDGYLRAEPGHPPSVAAAVMAASHLSGTFEKTLYVALEPLLCAHSRAEQTGCTRCLDLCPTGAITSAGDHVTVDPMICAGCGACSAACPSGAIRYDAPPVDEVFARIQTMAKAYTGAGGTAPRLLVVDSHGAEMIRLSARHGRGLPADVIPLELPVLGTFGHAEAIAAHAAGFADVTWLPGPKTDRTALDGEITLTRAISGDCAHILDTNDPDAMSDWLYATTPTMPGHTPVRPMGTRRQITRQAARALHGDTTLSLPQGAPYGAILVDTDACTLCLSCVSLCPSGALGDNPDLPQLRFQEDACLQCGICVSACPEDAITLAPQLDLTDAALEQRVLHEEEPFACVECGTLFGAKSTIDRITEKLTGHAMFSGDKLRMIQMCDDCRITSQAHSENNPFGGAPRPKPRTTDDYLSKRRDH